MRLSFFMSPMRVHTRGMFLRNSCSMKVISVSAAASAASSKDFTMFVAFCSAAFISRMLNISVVAGSTPKRRSECGGVMRTRLPEEARSWQDAESYRERVWRVRLRGTDPDNLSQQGNVNIETRRSPADAQEMC